jgi:hypothetical protein
MYIRLRKGERVQVVYLFRNPARNIKQVSSKQKREGLSKHGTPKYMCYIHENVTVAHTHTHTQSCKPEMTKHSIAIYQSIAGAFCGRYQLLFTA